MENQKRSGEAKKMKKILSNAVLCLKCGECVNSFFWFEIVSCSCGQCKISGGNKNLVRDDSMVDGITHVDYAQVCESDCNGCMRLCHERTF